MTTEEDTMSPDESSVVQLPDLVLTIEEAAKVLKIGRTKMCALLATGEVESVLIGRCRRVPVVSVERYIARLIPAQKGIADAA